MKNAKNNVAYQMKDSIRYINLFLLVVAGGLIYPMLYMRQIYLDTMLEAFQITNTQLGELYSIMGLLFFITYAPSGWLADKVKPMLLVVISLFGTALLGFWYAALPSYDSLLIIYAGWGCTTGLTFWGAVMKRIKLISKNGETGRFYGIYEGGRGGIEAILASVALYIFAVAAGDNGENVVGGLIDVIHMYSYCLSGLAVLSLIAWYYEIKEGQSQTTPTKKKVKKTNAIKELVVDIKMLLKIPEVWLIALVITAGYHLFWATYSFSSYLQNGDWGFTAVMAGAIITIKLWLRPIGGIGAGFIGDRFSNIRVLNILMILCVISLLALIFSPMMGLGSNTVYLGVFLILLIGLMTYMVRGLYWAIIEHLDVKQEKLGLAIGVISLIGYCPDIFIPLINGYIMDHASSDIEGLRVYFGYTAVMATIGVISGLILEARSHKNKAAKAISSDLEIELEDESEPSVVL